MREEGLSGIVSMHCTAKRDICWAIKAGVRQSWQANDLVAIWGTY
jgi:hypothetical protein